MNTFTVLTWMVMVLYVCTHEKNLLNLHFKIFKMFGILFNSGKSEKYVKNKNAYWWKNTKWSVNI